MNYAPRPASQRLAPACASAPPALGKTVPEREKLFSRWATFSGDEQEAVVSFSVDSLAQSCGLSLPTFIKERIGIMPRIACCIAQYHPDAGFSSASLRRPTPAGGRQQTPVDFVTGFCGLSRPTPFERIRTASGPAERLDNRIAVKVTKSFSRPVTRSPSRRGSMRARAGPAC
jgi:hypothetical protein